MTGETMTMTNGTHTRETIAVAIGGLMSTVEQLSDERIAIDWEEGSFRYWMQDGSTVTWSGYATFEVAIPDGWETEVHFDVSHFDAGDGIGTYLTKLAADPVGWCERAHRVAIEAYRAA